jgi:hypothetical protein
MTAVALAAAAPPGIPVINEDDINVSCYLNADEGSYLGSVMTFAPEQAARMCNKTFNACKGKCFGCMTDVKVGEEICYDRDGHRFLK